MYLLDTNVLSEVRKLDTDRTSRDFAEWFRIVPQASYFVCTPTILEIGLGIERLQRRDAAQASMLRRWFDSYVLQEFANRILDFDLAAARATAQLPVVRTLPTIDSMLAGIARVRGLTVATRNVKDFAGTGVPVVNPWDRATWH